MGSSIRMKERERPLRLRLEMIEVILGNISFPNELRMKGQEILGPGDKIFMFSLQDTASLCFRFFIIKSE